MVENIVELSVAAKELKEAHVEQAKTQAKLNASDIYWSGLAFKNTIMKAVKTDFDACPEIASEQAKLKKQADVVKATRVEFRPLSVVKAKVATDGMKALCQSILEPTLKHEIDGVDIKSVQSYRQAFEQMVKKSEIEFEAKLKAKLAALNEPIRSK
jgi:hypothetical protein